MTEIKNKSGLLIKNLAIWLKKLFSSRRRVIITVLVMAVLAVAIVKIPWSKKNTVQYQTTLVQKGTLITSISGTGSITSGNYTNISTKVSGVVSKVYVTNGDTVTKGQKIAQVTLDDYARERQTAAWVSYLEATEAVKDAKTAKVTADITMWQAREKILTSETDVNNNVGDTEGEKMVVKKTLEESRLAFSAAESKYLHADSDIANAQAKVSAALRNYQENSATILAPASGVVSDLSLAPGLLVNASSATSSTSGATIVSAQTVGKVSSLGGQLVASVSLTEIDIVKVKANQKVTITLDAYPDHTFTGKVLAVNTSGNVSSNVTSYPVTILLDPTEVEIYPNMTANVEIITFIKTDALLVPSTAVQTINDQTVVEVMKNGSVTPVQVEIGSSNDSQTEITSGLNEGDEVVTAIISSAPAGSSSTQNGEASPFSGLNRAGTGGTTRNSGGGMPGGNFFIRD